MDEPFIIQLKGGDFVTVRYTFHTDDIVSFPFLYYCPAGYERALKDEFDQLNEEGADRRRMMVVSLHDRIAGHASRIRAHDRFLAYAKSKRGVWFARTQLRRNRPFVPPEVGRAATEKRLKGRA